jgi:hypothetical protein
MTTLPFENAPAVALRDLPSGTRVAGLAPIGIPWSATVRWRDGYVFLSPDKGCPRGEFAPIGGRLADGSAFRLEQS